MFHFANNYTHVAAVLCVERHLEALSLQHDFQLLSDFQLLFVIREKQIHFYDFKILRYKWLRHTYISPKRRRNTSVSLNFLLRNNISSQLTDAISVTRLICLSLPFCIWCFQSNSFFRQKCSDNPQPDESGFYRNNQLSYSFDYTMSLVVQRLKSFYFPIFQTTKINRSIRSSVLLKFDRAYAMAEEFNTWRTR